LFDDDGGAHVQIAGTGGPLDRRAIVS
jgi:hypothetical protein